MTKYGPAVGRGAGVEHAGDGRVRHPRERLSLRLESRHDAVGVEAAPDQLERHLAPDRRGLLGAVDHTHPAFADDFEQPVGANLTQRLFRRDRGHRRPAA